jgi:uncharacterized protein (DUF58 family)
MLFLKDLLVFNQLSMLAQKAMEGFISGLHKSPLRGFSVEFAEHRSYNEGDSIRNLDWKLLAKTEKKYIKQTIEETNLRCFFWMDISKSMKYPEGEELKLKYSLALGSILAQALAKQRDAFQFSLLDEQKLKWQSDIKSTKGHLSNVFSKLEQLWNFKDLDSEWNQEFTFAKLASVIPRRSMIVICTDMLIENDQDFWETLKYLKFLKCEILLIHVQHNNHELKLDLEAIPYEFVDLENQSRIKLNPDEIKEAYRVAQTEYTESVIRNCQQLGISYFEGDVSFPLDYAIMQFYKERNKLK